MTKSLYRNNTKYFMIYILERRFRTVDKYSNNFIVMTYLKLNLSPLFKENSNFIYIFIDIYVCAVSQLFFIIIYLLLTFLLQVLYTSSWEYLSKMAFKRKVWILCLYFYILTIVKILIIVKTLLFLEGRGIRRGRSLLTQFSPCV